MQIMGGGKGEKREKNDQALKNAQPHMLNVNGIIYIYQNSKLLSPFVCFDELVYWLFGQSNMHHLLDFCPRPARKETNEPLHK